MTHKMDELAQTLFEEAGDGLYFFDPEDGHILDVNPMAQRMTGRARHELLQMSVKSLFSSEVAGGMTRLFHAYQSTGLFHSQEGFLLRHARPGVQIPVNLTVTRLHTRRGVLGLITARDISERRQAEEELRGSESRYRALFDASPLPTWVCDRVSLTFLMANEAAVAHYGFSRDEFLGMGLGDLDPEGEFLILLRDLPQSTSALGSLTPCRQRTKDGKLVDVELTSRAIIFGEKPALLVLAHDVTERRRVQAARERLTEILEATPDFVAISHVEGPASYINAAGRRLLGVEPEELVCLADHRPEWARRLILEEAIPAAIDQGVWKGETALRSRSGEEIPVSQVLIAHKTPAGRLEFLSTIARDVREQRRMETELRQAQKMEAIGQLAGGVAHDFNNLLTVINGCSELLLASMQGDDHIMLVREILGAGERATAVTRQLLAFGRRQLLTPVVLDLNPVLDAVSKMLRRLIGEDIELATDLDPNLPPIKADTGQLDQVILNLAVNARDAMPVGGRLTLRTASVVLTERDLQQTPEVSPGRYALLAVKDTGCGMTAEVQARIFEPFFTTKEVGKGTGLGLATVYGIVKQSGGHITVDSAPGCGTTFNVYLPLAPPALDPPLTEQGSPGELPEASIGRETILLVEDEDSVRRISRLTLEKNGYRVLEARGGQEALEASQAYAGRIHLLVTDVVMPGLSGRELAERLLLLRPSLRVLFVSGYTDDAVLRHGVFEDEVSLLAKPFAPRTLARRVREVLDQARPPSGFLSIHDSHVPPEQSRRVG